MALKIKTNNPNPKDNKTYIGVVEDNKDPKKNGRCRIRVMDVFDGKNDDGTYRIKTDEIPWAFPWKDLNGNAFNIPDIGKIVIVVFEEGNPETPEYISADHYNVNLEKKLESLTNEEYISMKSLIFDHKTQIYVNDTEGLKMDYKFNNVNIKDQSINVNLKDNFAKLNLGTENATQRAILGDTFTNWLDELLNIFMSGAFLGNLGAPLVPAPSLVKHIQLYQTIKDPKILSKNVFIVDNEDVKVLEKVNETTFKGSPIRVSDPTIGDNWTSTVEDNSLTKKEEVGFQPVEGSSSTTFKQPDANSPNKPTPANLEPEVKEANPDIKVLIELLKNKNYKLFTKDFELNIIAVRNQCMKLNDNYTDEFVDKLYVLYKVGDWKLKKYIFSTMPGKEFTLSQEFIDSQNLSNYTALNDYINKRITMKEFYEITKNDKISGIQTLVPSQYINVYEMGNRFNSDALVSTVDAKQLIWLDNDFKRPEFLPSNLANPISENKYGTGDFGISIQIGFPGGKKVGNWSIDGSQTLSTKEDAAEFFELCKTHKDMIGDNFTYTLVTKADWDNAVITAESNKLDKEKTDETKTNNSNVEDSKKKIKENANDLDKKSVFDISDVPTFVSILESYVGKKEGGYTVNGKWFPNNSGKMVTYFLGNVGLDNEKQLKVKNKEGNYEGFAWCMAFVYTVFKELSERKKIKSPLFKSAAVLNFWSNSKTDFKLPKSKYITDKSLVKSGQIFIKERKGGGHTGLVLRVEGDQFISIDGNSNDTVRLNRYNISDMLGFVDHFNNEEIYKEIEIQANKIISKNDITDLTIKPQGGFKEV